MLCNFVVDVAALRELGDDALQGAGLAVQPGRQSHDGSLRASQLCELCRRTAGLTDLDHVTGLDLVRGDVDLLAIDGKVSVAHQLAGVAAGLSKAQAEHDVVQAALHELEQVLTGLAGHRLSTQVSIVELLFQNAVDELDLLLFLQLRSVLRLLLAHVAIGVAGGILLCIAHDRRRNAQGLATLCDRLRILCHNSISSFDQTRRRFGGRQPLWGMGVTSLIRVTSRPVA